MSWFTAHRWLVVSALLVTNIGLLAIVAFAVLPTHEPAIPTEARYSDLAAGRALRSAVHAEPVPPSVLQGAHATPAPTVKVEAFAAPVSRLRIPSINVDAPVQVKNIKDGAMENPDGPANVAWYDFTPKPGIGTGNGVFSGHVDYVKVGPAVFWDLRKLVAGDSIEVALSDGTVIKYAVTASWLYPLNEVPMADVLANTSTESITLITCGGTFSGGAYTHRYVLRATRIDAVKG